MKTKAFIGLIIVILIVISIYYMYNYPAALSELRGIISSTKPTVNIPEIQANPISYLNQTLEINATLETFYIVPSNESAYTQAGINNQLYEYFSSNQTNWYLALKLPNQPNRQWEYGSSYLFSGHLSELYACHTVAGGQIFGNSEVIQGSWSVSQNSTCWDNITTTQHTATPSNSSKYHCISKTNSTFLGGLEYTCYPYYPAQVLYYFNATNATLNG